MNTLLKESRRAEGAALDRIAAFAAGTRVADMPAAVVDKARDCVLDALSACLTAGAALEGNCAAAIGAGSRGEGESTLIGTSSMGTPSGAAFVNATNAASTSRSDTHPASASHPGTVVIPAALALAEARNASGAMLIEAVVSGYETMCRLGIALVTPEFAAIFRPTGMVAPTAGAIAAGLVLALSPDRLRNAASLATHTASGLNEWANAGTPELAFHSGFAARNGVDAALLAEAGALSAPTILEGKSGLLAGYGALDRAHLLTEGLGEHYKLLEIVHKPAPACIYVQTPCQLARQLVREHGLTADAIRSVEIKVSRPAAMYPGCDDSTPIMDAQAAKLSIQFAVASVLVAGGISDANWREFRNAQANALAARSSVVVDDGLTDATGRQGAGMRIVLADGKVIEGRQHAFIPMTQQDLHERFMAVAVPKLGAERSDRVVELVKRLESLSEVRELTRLLRLAS